MLEELISFVGESTSATRQKLHVSRFRMFRTTKPPMYVTIFCTYSESEQKSSGSVKASSISKSSASDEKLMQFPDESGTIPTQDRKRRKMNVNCFAVGFTDRSSHRVEEKFEMILAELVWRRSDGLKSTAHRGLT